MKEIIFPEIKQKNQVSIEEIYDIADGLIIAYSGNELTGFCVRNERGTWSIYENYYSEEYFDSLSELYEAYKDTNPNFNLKWKR